MSERKQIAQEDWASYLNETTLDNKGRLVGVDVILCPDVTPESVGERSSTSVPISHAPLVGVGYDPVTKANAIIIAVGMGGVEHEHSIGAPVELIANLGADGCLDSLEVFDENGTQTKLNFLDLGER